MMMCVELVLQRKHRPTSSCQTVGYDKREHTYNTQAIKASNTFAIDSLALKTPNTIPNHPR
eukprot:5299936-Pyramimonas_sp.AAC.1